MKKALNIFTVLFFAMLLFAWLTKPSVPALPVPPTHDQLMWKRVDQAKSIIRETAHNPSALKFDREHFSTTEDIVCIEYRGTNAFGGIVRGYASMKDGKFSDSRAIFVKNCT